MAYVAEQISKKLQVKIVSTFPIFFILLQNMVILMIPILWIVGVW